MKKLIFIPTVILLIVNCSLLKAQEDSSSGTIIYEEILKFALELNGDSEAFADMLPNESKSEKVLYFNSGASLYKNVENEESESSVIEQESQDMLIVVEIANPDDKVYTDLQNKQVVEQTEFMSRQFLIIDEMKEYSWKLTGNQKKILDYNCQEAISVKDDSIITTAWFTPEIPASVGPASFSGLPGAILFISADNGDYTITAKSVSTDIPNEEVFEKPKKGKKVSREEYEKIVEEKNKEMEEQYGSGGGVFIEIETR
ncbi:MAG: hypothetical protein C0596_02820 [Marinilabiliales bacterium]|nr:MAG: hypothetical protein C0596_02820 [Marinilabiliales bacterium]